MATLSPSELDDALGQFDARLRALGATQSRGVGGHILRQRAEVSLIFDSLERYAASRFGSPRMVDSMLTSHGFRVVPSSFCGGSPSYFPRSPPLQLAPSPRPTRRVEIPLPAAEDGLTDL